MFARTERLLLRPGWAEDAPALHQAIADEMIVRNLAHAPWPYQQQDADQFLTSWTQGVDCRFLMVQRTAKAPRLIGCIGLEPCVDGGMELGYWIARPYWGLGFATEAGRHMVQLAKSMGHRQIKAAHFIDNPASGAVLRKLGFRATGERTQRYSIARGADVTSVEYSHDLAAGDAEPCTPAAMRPAPWPHNKRDDWRLDAA
jgi:RimJ/RimL family protein N-acetyltransferase